MKNKNNLLLMIIVVAVIVGGLLIFKYKQVVQFSNKVANKQEHVILTPEPTGPSTLGVFEGRTPCQDFLLAFTRFSVDFPDGCQRIKWLITFYQDERTGNPTRYIFGIQGREESHRGDWIIKKGISSDSEAVVYELHPDDNRERISLLKVGNDHLFFLDKNMEPLIGDKLLSYTLSKTADSYETRKSTLN